MSNLLALPLDATVVGLLVALGVGLLIGVERERRKGEGQARGAAGVRTFAIAALVGALANRVGGLWALVAALVSVAALATAAYLRGSRQDPGLTTEVALVLTVLLGAAALSEPALTAALGVCVVALLAVRAPLHRFIRAALSEDELRDGLILAIATFVVWPFLPAESLGPFGALNLHAVWLVVILVMTIGAFGHVAVRLIGVRLGVPIAGFFSGFISSAATIGAMGARAARNPEMIDEAVAGAVLSTVATILQLGALLAVIDVEVARALIGPLALSCLAAVLYAGYFLAVAIKSQTDQPAAGTGRAFSIGGALLFGALVCVVLVVSAALQHWFGERGLTTAVAVAGIADAHAAAASTAALAAGGALSAQQAAVPILTAFTANTLTKIALAFGSRDRRFIMRVTPGLVLVAVAAWAGLALPAP